HCRCISCVSVSQQPRAGGGRVISTACCCSTAAAWYCCRVSVDANSIVMDSSAAARFSRLFCSCSLRVLPACAATLVA
ncbi:hypothetical protein HaLaN_32740, partial [Haematococcus lacustris]